MSLTCFHFQSEPVSDEGDELRIRGFSLMIIDGVAEEGIDGIHLASVPCNLDGVADCEPSAPMKKETHSTRLGENNLPLCWLL